MAKKKPTVAVPDTHDLSYSLLADRLDDQHTFFQEELYALAEAAGLRQVCNDGVTLEWRPVDGESADSPATISDDGPVAGYRWRHNGVVIEATMPVGAWRLVSYLWRSQDKAATINNQLAAMIHDDHAFAGASTDDYLFSADECKNFQNDANTYFRKRKISWLVKIKGGTVFLTAPTKAK